MNTEAKVTPIPTIAMPDPCCKTCKWGTKAKHGKHYECHRYPPQVSSFMVEQDVPGPLVGSRPVKQIGYQDRSVFPLVQGEHICGEYQPDLGRAN